LGAVTTRHSRPLKRGRPVRWSGLPGHRSLLRWVYLTRVTLATVVYVGLLIRLPTGGANEFVIASVAVILTLVFTGVSSWQTHGRRQPPSETFLYLQSLFDLGLVTVVVHVTGGAESNFFPLYVPVIAIAAVVIPVRGTLLVSVLAGVVYFADIFWGQAGGQFGAMTPTVWMQLGVFLVVALLTAYVGSRVRVLGEEKAVLERELSRVQLEAADILRNIRTGVLTVDRDGRLLFANPAADDILGIQASEWTGQVVAEQLARISPEFWATIQTTVRDGVRLVRQEAVVHRGNRSFPIGVTTTVLESGVGGAPAGVTAIFTDISQHKRVEELRLRAERLEAVAALSASLAHEIKNPLASIRSSVEQLSRARSRAGEDTILANLIVRESDRLNRLLSEFLDFSRVRVTRVEAVDLFRVSQAAVRLVREHPDCPGGASIEIHGQSCLVEGDEDLLHRIVVNLVLNAVQAAGDGAQIAVRVSPTKQELLPRGVLFDRPVTLAVSDNGPGIPEHVREQLFDPFVSGRPGGSGLGLAIVQRAVQAHRGLVLVDSDPARGTTFTIVLPASGSVRDAA